MGWTPEKQFDDFGAIPCPAKSLFDFEVRHRKLRFACRLKRHEGAGCLIASLTGFIPRLRFDPPVFLRADSNIPAHVLAVSDPAFFLDETIRSSFFVGTRDDDAISGLIAVAHAVAASLGVDRARLVYWGSSSGGFGAAMAAIRSGNGNAVLVNSAFELAKFKSRPAAPALTRIFHEGTTDEMLAGYPLRMSVGAALTKARQDGAYPKLLVVQNKVDRIFHEHQYTPFCDAFGLPVAGGFDQSATPKAMTYSHPDGHGREPDGVLADILDCGFPLTFG